MKHIKTFETFSQEDIMVDEGWKEIKSAITKPFRRRTDEEIEIEASRIIDNGKKLKEIVDILKNNDNPIHFENFQEAQEEYDNGNEMPFYKFILFVNDNLDEFEAGNPMYYSIDPETGDVKDTRQMSYNPSGPGGRSWGE